jgi:hypothetical protein
VASCFTAWSSKRQPLTRFSQSKSVAEPWTPKPQYMGVTSVKWIPQKYLKALCCIRASWKSPLVSFPRKRESS